MVLRKLAVALLGAGVMLPGLSHALAVKELQTKSALGEPFRAEVELIELGDLTSDEIKVSLASQEDFERIGVDRVYFLNELRFDVEVNQAGRSFIRVTSSKPVVEPYLNFVLRISWPGNARLHEVTALLDPPMTAEAEAPVVEAPEASAPVEPVAAPVAEPAPEPVAPDAPVAEAPAPVVAEEPAPEARPEPAPQPVAPTPAPVPAAPDSYKVKAGDTISGIAGQVRATGVTTSQAMIALQRANPDAFANDNINQLKRGQVLRIPSEAQMREVSAQEAVASVREQTAAWRAATGKVAAAAKPALEAPQVDATAAPAPREAAPAPEPKPEMKLLGAETGKAGAAAAGKEKGAARPDETRKLAQVKNLAESAKVEKEKLAGKVQTLDAKVKANDKKVDVQNARLAELEAQLREQEAKAAAAKAAKPAKVEAAPAPATVAPATPATPADSAAPADAATQTPEQVAAEAAPAAPAKPAPAPKKKPVVVQEEPVEEPSMLPMIAGGALALLAVLGGGWFWQRRRREQADAESTLAELEAMDDATAEAEGGFAAAPQADGLDDSWLNEPAVVAAAPAAADRVLADPLEEAEQYIAYERYPQAVGLLTRAIAASPDRADLRMKLLEVYAHQDDWSGFAEQEAWFERAGDLGAVARAEELKAGMTAPAGGASARDDGLLAFTSSKPAAGDELPSLEDLEMDFNASPSSSTAAPAADDLSFDLDGFDEPPALAPAAAKAAQAPAADALDDLSFELDNDAFAEPAPSADGGLDFSLEEEAPAAAASSAGMGLGELTDLEAELDFTPASKPAAAPAAKAADDDLSFSLDDLELAAEPVTAPEVTLDEDFDLGAGLDDAATALADDLSFDLGAEEPVALDTAGEFDLEAEAAAAGLDDFDSTLQLEPEAPAAAPAPAAQVQAAAPAAPAADAGDLGMDDEFDFLADTDENATKLDLARAYIDMGDMEGARDILQEVLSEGSAPQKDEAKGLLAQVG